MVRGRRRPALPLSLPRFCSFPYAALAQPIGDDGGLVDEDKPGRIKQTLLAHPASRPVPHARPSGGAPSSCKHTVASEIPCSQVQKSLLIAVKFPAPWRREFCRKPLMCL